MDLFNFSNALRYLKEGRMVSRRGWMIYGFGSDSRLTLEGRKFKLFANKAPGVEWRPGVPDLLADDWFLYGGGA